MHTWSDVLCVSQTDFHSKICLLVTKQWHLQLPAWSDGSKLSFSFVSMTWFHEFEKVKENLSSWWWSNLQVLISSEARSQMGWRNKPDKRGWLAKLHRDPEKRVTKCIQTILEKPVWKLCRSCCFTNNPRRPCVSRLYEISLYVATTEKNKSSRKKKLHELNFATEDIC